MKSRYIRGNHFNILETRMEVGEYKEYEVKEDIENNDRRFLTLFVSGLFIVTSLENPEYTADSLPRKRGYITTSVSKIPIAGTYRLKCHEPGHYVCIASKRLLPLKGELVETIPYQEITIPKGKNFLLVEGNLLKPQAKPYQIIMATTQDVVIKADKAGIMGLIFWEKEDATPIKITRSPTSEREILY